MITTATTYEETRGTVDSALAGTIHDLTVTIDGPWHELTTGRRSSLDEPMLDLRLLGNLYAGEPRVNRAAKAPYRLTIPAGWALGADSIAKLVKLAEKEGFGLVCAALAETHDGVAVARLERTAAFNRALLFPGEDVDDVVDELFGAHWVDGAEFGIVPVDDAEPIKGDAQTWRGGGRETPRPRCGGCRRRSSGGRPRPTSSPPSPGASGAGGADDDIHRGHGRGRRRGHRLDGELHLDPETETDEVTILAKTPTDLRRAMTLQSLLPKAKKVSVVIAEAPYWFTAPSPALTPAHRWRALTEVRTFKKGAGWQVDVTFNAPTPSGRVVTAVARAFSGNRLEAIASPVPVLAGPGAAHWRPGDPNAAIAEPKGPMPIRIERARRGPGGPHRRLGPLGRRRRDRRPVGLAELGGDRASRRREAAGGRADRPRAGAAGRRPFGQPDGVRQRADQGIGELTLDDDGWVIRLGTETLTRIAGLRRGHGHGRRPGPQAARDRDRLAARAHRPADRRPGRGRAGRRRGAAGLRRRARRGREALGPGLGALLRARKDVLDDDLTREEHSIRLRRRALRDHGVKERWARLGAVGSYLPTTSILLATRRPDQVAFALEQAGRQREADLEVVLALHGVPRSIPASRRRSRSSTGR